MMPSATGRPGARVRGAEVRTALLALLAGAAPALAQQSGPSATLVADGAEALAPGESVTLDEAIRLALRVQPSVVNARSIVVNADATRKLAFGAYLPNVNATGTGSTLFSESARPDPVTGIPVLAGSSTQSVSFGLNANLLLFTGFQRGANSRAALALIDNARFGAVNAEYQVRLLVSNQFYATLAAGELVKVRQASVRRAEEQLRTASAKLKAGSATKSDSLRSLVQLGNAQADLATASATLVQAEATLGQYVGGTGRVRASGDSLLTAAPAALDLETLRAEAIARSPAVQAVEATAAANRAQLAAAKSAYYPTVTANGSLSFNGNNLGNYQLFQQRQLSIGVNWPLFNRFQRESNIMQQTIQIELADATAADTRRQVGATVTGQLALADAAAERIRITAVNVEAAREDLRVQRTRYEAGSSTILDVLTSQEALNQAEVNVINARFDWLRAKAQLEALIGRTL